MSLVNLDDVRAQLLSVDLILDKDLSFDGSFQRWRVAGEDREKRGWSRLREWVSKSGKCYIVGAYGVWRGADDGYRKIEISRSSIPSLSDDDIEAIRAAQREAQKKVAETRKAEAKRAARWAAAVWARCGPCEEHEYLSRKRIAPNGARVLVDAGEISLDQLDESNNYRLKSAVGALVVPMHDEHGNVCGIQFIYPAGHPRRQKIGRDKEFWPSGMAMGGTFGVIGPIKRDGIILVAEGFATAASLHEATGQTAAYAFSANNLIKAGKLLRKTCHNARILFCADDDYLCKCPSCSTLTLVDDPICAHCGSPHGKRNDGVFHAAAAMAEIDRSAWVVPDFVVDGEDIRRGQKLSDFNDLSELTGIPLTLARQLNAKLDALGWNDAASKPRARITMGDGEEPAKGKRRRAQSVMPIDDLVARFIPIDDGTGKFVFDTWTNKIASREQMVSLLPAGVRGDDIKRHPGWIERGAYYLDQVGFDPAGTDQTVELNTWRGWPLTPKRGECSNFLELIRYLCSGEKNSEEVYRWLIRWMAYPLQNPGAKMSSAVIMHGPQGTGKSTVFQTLARIYGDYSTVLNQRGLEDRFNADWSDSKLFILAEEVVTRAEMWHIKNELKELVTGEWIRVNPKNIAAYRQRNHLNIVYLSNEGQPLPIDNDDRRHLVVYTPGELEEEFYDLVNRELDAGGVEAFYDYLLSVDLGDFHPKKRPPMTDAKQSLIALSAPSEMRFVTEWIDGTIGLPICAARAEDVYSVYLKWCRSNGETRPRPSNHFHGTIGRIPGWTKKKQRIFNDLNFTGTTIGRPLIIPPLAAMQADGHGQPDGMPETQWMTTGVIAFELAMRGEDWQKRHAA